MLLLEIIEVLVATLVVYIGITQVLLPWARGTMYFPMFRPARKLEKRIKEAKQALEEARLESEAEKLEGKIKKEQPQWTQQNPKKS